MMCWIIIWSYLKKKVTICCMKSPWGTVSGVQTQIPVLLSEYQFQSKEDVDAYLELMKTTPDYFNSLIAFEQEKAQKGLFMASYTADTVIEQCQAFIDMGDSNYLISTFVDRIQKLTDLSESEKSDYIQKNAYMLQTYVLSPQSPHLQLPPDSHFHTDSGRRSH